MEDRAMGWVPPDRPEWVLAVNRGEIIPISEVANLPLTREGLMREAAARQGRPSRESLDHLYGHPAHPAEPVVENLDRLTASLREEAALSTIGRFLTRRFIMRLLEVRIQILDALRADPGLAEEEIHEPLFVAGAPRTGTTILFELLALDSRRRAPRGWELLRPVPSPEPPRSHLTGNETAADDPRVDLAERELIAPQTVVEGIRTIHSYGARQPKECLSAMSFALQSEEFSARYRVPGYSDWLENSDMQPAYAMHRLVLQILQRRWPDTAWVLKSPVHLHSLSALFETYPDARVAITHRDPLRFLGSLTSLICNLRWAHSDEVDSNEIGRAQHHRYRRTLDSLSSGWAEGRWPQEQMHHSLFHEFMEDPLEVVESVYEKWGERPGPDLRARLETHPAVLTKGPAVAHQYQNHELGGDAEATRRDFSNYQEAFGVPSEG